MVTIIIIIINNIHFLSFIHVFYVAENGDGDGDDFKKAKL